MRSWCICSVHTHVLHQLRCLVTTRSWMLVERTSGKGTLAYAIFARDLGTRRRSTELFWSVQHILGDAPVLHALNLQPTRSDREVESVSLERSMRRLVTAVKDLSRARSNEDIAAIVRTAARDLNGADGATFVLREGEKCFYFDEDAIAPLWKGKRFPLDACISGWVMQHRRHVSIEDVYSDPRIPHDAYRPTFVKSLVMVPVRREAPIAAIGNYWATRHVATAQEIELIQALADSTSVAMENVRVYEELEERVRRRTEQLELSNRELGAFSYTVSHDLKSPLNTVAGFAQLLEKDLGPSAPEQARSHLRRIIVASMRMGDLIDDLLDFSRTTRADLFRTNVNLSALARETIGTLLAKEPERTVDLHIAEGMFASADERLVRILIENLLSNALKYTQREARATISVGRADRDGVPAYFVQDDGVGFDPASAGKLFQPFNRLHRDEDFHGTGVGLSTCERIVRRHGGWITAESKPGEGATFRFSLGTESA